MRLAGAVASLAHHRNVFRRLGFGDSMPTRRFRFARLRPALTAALLAIAWAHVGPATAGAAPAPLSPSVVGEDPQGNGVFRFPQAVAVSDSGNRVFVGDQYSGVVQAFDGAGRHLFNLGSRATRDEPGRLGVVGGVAVDRTGHLYVLDAENDRVQVFVAASGQHLATWGDPSVFDLMSGFASTGVGISASGIAVFQAPGGPPVVYVADAGNDRVERFVLDPATLLPVGDPQISNPAIGLEAPQGLTLDATGTKLYVADDVHHRVVVLASDGLGFLAQAGAYGTGPGQFQNPYDVAVDSSTPPRLYVADNLGARVQVFDATTLQFLQTIGRPGYGPGVGQMSIIRAVGALADGPRGVYVADTAGNRIQQFDPAGNVLSAWGVAGRGPGYVSRPRGVAFTPDGGVAVADTFDERVALFSPDGTFVDQRGLISQITGFTFPGAETGQFKLPEEVAYDTGGNLWVADTGNDRVVMQNAAGGVLATSPPGAFISPRGLAAAPAGGMYVADEDGGSLSMMDGAGGVTLVRNGLTRPVAVAVAGDGTPFVAETKAIRNATTGVTIPGPDGPQWDRPNGLAFDTSGTLYVVERRPLTPNGARVLRGTPDGLGGFVWDVLATEGAGVGEVIEPGGIAVNAAGTTMLVADSGNNRILRFDAPGTSPPVTRRLVASVNDLNRGTVVSDLPGIACVTDCSQRYGGGRAVTLTAAPRPGFVFAGWGGDCAPAGATPLCTVAMTADRSASASFDPAPIVAPPPAPVALVVTKVSIKPSTLRQARAANRRRHIKARKATRAKVRVTLSRAATISVRVLIGKPGRRQGSSCRVPSRANRKRKPCTRYVALAGRRTLKPAKATHTFRISPQWNKRTLRRGHYRLSVAAIEAGGARIAPVTKPYRIIR